jgi:beta-galactosidase
MSYIFNKEGEAMVIKMIVAALGFVVLLFTVGSADTYTGEPSNRVKINLGETPWKFIKSDPPNLAAKEIAYNDAAFPNVGIPHTWNDSESFLNQASGGGDGEMFGGPVWYRKHFTLDSKYSDKKIFVEFEGVHVGVQVYVNGTFMPGNSVENPQATHVIGFIGFVLDITSQVKFGGADNVIAARVSKSQGFYADPGFSLVFRFGQADAGIFRPVWMHITDKVHVPLNLYSCLNQLGTYVGAQTVANDGSSATVDIKTNVQNDGAAATSVTLTTKMVDATNTVVWTGDLTQSVAAGASSVFDQIATITNPKLWYPNNSPYGKPYMHKVYHILKVNGTTIDVFEETYGIRVITWDNNFPYINGHKHQLYGASARYDYPALATALPPEVEWRDAKLLADIGGSLWRPGHSSCSPGFVDACDNEGVMLIQPSGEGEGAFGGSAINDNGRGTLKGEIQRDVYVRDRNHPSILSWEVSNGPIATPFAQALKALAVQWDPIHTRAQADRTPNPANGDILSCTVVGCEIGVKNNFPNNPAWGAEWWSDYGRMARFEYDYELAFCADYMNTWVNSRAKNCFGMAQWYMAETPGEDGISLPYKNAATYPKARSFECSMMDFNRIPKLLYYGYQACWIPFSSKPVVTLAHHWNRSGMVRVNAFSNCPQVRLLVNGKVIGIKTPNPLTGVAPNNDHSQTTKQLPAQVWWDSVTWVAGTLRAEGLDASGNVVCSDEKKTAGAADHIVLIQDPPVAKPNGEVFKIRANSSDAALILAKVVDANGNWCPTATGLITFSVTGPGNYRGGTDQYVDATKPKTWHAPTDHELSIEGGMAKVAVRSTFTSGVVTVNATSSGLGAGSTTFVVYNLDGTPPSGASMNSVKVPYTAPSVRFADVGGALRYYISRPAFVSFEVLTASGRMVARLPGSLQVRGWHPLALTKANGVYFVHSTVDGKDMGARRMMVVR